MGILEILVIVGAVAIFILTVFGLVFLYQITLGKKK